MNKSDILLRVVSALVFCAMVAYMAVYIMQRVSEPVQKALVVSSTMTDSSTISGLVVRDELVISSDAPYTNVTVSDGEKVGAGQTVAIVYGSEEALQRATDLVQLETEIRNVENALSGTDVVSAARSRETSVYDAIIDLSATLRNKGYAGIDTSQSTLAGLVFRSETVNATEEYLDELRVEYAELSRTAADEMDEIGVEDGGTWSTVLDGYEDIGPAEAKELTPSSLRELMRADRMPEEEEEETEAELPEGAEPVQRTKDLGKLVRSYRWYYAAIVPREDASRLVAGRTVRLSFGRYYSDFVTAKVEYVGQAEGDEQIILFSMDRGFAEMMTVRAVSAEIVYSEYSGLRVPVRSVYRYYAGYLSDEDCASLEEGGTVRIAIGDAEYIAFVSEIGSARRYGDLAPGVEEDSDADTRPKRRLVVFCWPYSDEDTAPDFSVVGALVKAADGKVLPVTNYYEYHEDTDRMCVFAMTGLQAERKKVELTYAGEEYALVESTGSDALREGNEVIVETSVLFNGKVFR